MSELDYQLKSISDLFSVSEKKQTQQQKEIKKLHKQNGELLSLVQWFQKTLEKKQKKIKSLKKKNKKLSSSMVPVPIKNEQQYLKPELEKKEIIIEDAVDDVIEINPVLLPVKKEVICVIEDTEEEVEYEYEEEEEVEYEEEEEEVETTEVPKEKEVESTEVHEEEDVESTEVHEEEEVEVPEEEEADGEEEDPEGTEEEADCEEGTEVVEEEVPEGTEEEEEEEEVIVVKINGTRYYTNNETNGDIYEIGFDGDIGKEVGSYKDGKAIFYKTKK